MKTENSRTLTIFMAILAGLAALFGGMGVGGLGADNPTVALVGAWGTLAVSAATIAVERIVQNVVTPTAFVAEHVDVARQAIIAGPANDTVPSGGIVRRIDIGD